MKKEKTKKNRKEIIKSITIIFLAIMLVLTFFSNTIMNYSLPEVSATYVYGGSVTSRVRGSGMVESAEDYEVKVDSNMLVSSVKVKVGDTVEADQVLFELESGEAADENTLKEAKETLDSLELEYNKALLSASPSYALDLLEIDSAQAELNDALAKQAIAGTRDNLVAQQLILQQQVDGLTAEVGSLTGALEEAENSEAITLVNTRQEKRDRLDAVKSAISDYEGKIEADPDNKDEYEEKLKKSKDEKKQLTEEIKKLNEQIEGVEIPDLDKMREDIGAKQGELDKAQGDLANLTVQIDSIPTKEEADATVRDKQKALDTLKISLADKQSADKVTKGQEQLELEALKSKVDNQRELVTKLEGGEDKPIEIKAKNSGVIKSVNCIAGDTVTPDLPLAVMAVTGNGYSVSFTVTNEQSKLVRKGQKAEVLNIWGMDIDVTLEEIRADINDPNNSKLLIFSVKGEDVTVGTNLELSVGEKSAPYDTIVPNSAIREDNNGKFVLVVNVKSSPLGNRYILSRTNIDVIASDDTNSAVSGGLMGYEYVVTNSSAPLEPGMKVRLAE